MEVIGLSLQCAETGKAILSDEPLFVAVKPGVKFGAFLSKKAIKKIPMDDRGSNEAVEGDGGVNIHDAYATGGGFGTYEWSHGMDIGEFLFSFDRKAAKRYLPTLMRDYFPDE